METTTYFQGKNSVDDYIDKFKDLIDLSGYTEGTTIVVKFRRGLNPEIQDYVAQMMEGRPADDDIDEWYTAASQCDESHRANAAFRSSIKPMPSAHPQIFPTLSPALPVHPPNPPRIPPSAPMDVDAAKRGKVQTIICYRCGETGHLRKDCPHGFDVRFMTEEERADWIQQLLVSEDLRDVVEREGEAEEKDGIQGDFASSNE